MKNEAAKEMKNKTISGALAGGNNIISFSLYFHTYNYKIPNSEHTNTYTHTSTSKYR